jgi:hypothetical protein
LKYHRFEESDGYIGSKISDNEYSFIMPYWTPGETIKWLLRRMRTSQYSGYLFYSNTRGFNLITLPTILDVSKNGEHTDKNEYFFEPTNKNDYFNENLILNWKMYPPLNSALSYLPGGTLMSPKFESRI